MDESLPAALREELKRLAAARTANEAEVETKILLHVFRLLGYSDSDRADKPPVVMFFGREQKTKIPDFVFYDGEERSLSNALVAVEAKDGAHTIAEAVSQVKSYAVWAGTPFYVACNGVWLRAVQFIPGTDDHRFVEIEIANLSARWRELEAFVSRAQAILAKERLAYTALYLPDIEKLPPQDFFREYLTRVAQRFSGDTKQSQALDASPSHLHIPRIPVSARFDGSIGAELDEHGMFGLGLLDSARLLVTGQPGSGKSTLLRRIAFRATQVSPDRRRDILPVFVRLTGGVPDSVVSAFSIACTDMGVRFLQNLYRIPLGQAHVLLLLDGLDEIELSELNLSKLALLLEDCGTNALILSSRTLLLEDLESKLPLDGFEVGSISELSDASVQAAFVAYLGNRAQSVLDSIPSEFRQDLRSPLLALMMIRVAQTVGDWTSFTRFTLFEKYVVVLDQFFNNSAVRGNLGRGPGQAIADLTAAASVMNAAGHQVAWSLESLAAALAGRGRDGAVTSLVNIGLLTSAGRVARFIHQSFADFGLARYMLDRIAADDPSSVTGISPSGGTYDLLHSELTPVHEEVLIRWIRVDSQPLNRRVYQIVFRGGSPRLLDAVRRVWTETGKMGRLMAAARVLAANGDVQFLEGCDRHISGDAETARSRILARVLGNSGRREYLPILQAMARVKQKRAYTMGLFRLVLRTGTRADLDEIIATYPQNTRKTRLAMAKLLDPHQYPDAASILLNSFMRNESEPDVALILIYSARNIVQDLDEQALSSAAHTLARLSTAEHFQADLATRFVESVVSRGLKSEPIERLIVSCERIAHLSLVK